MPGVERIALASRMLLSTGRSQATFRLGDDPTPHVVDVNTVSPEFFSLLGMPIVRGRVFTDGEIGVALVTESTAQRYWPGPDAIGRTINTDGGRRQIVGIVRDAQVAQAPEAVSSYLYLPAMPGTQRGISVLARTRVEITGFATAVRAETSRMDAGLVVNVMPLSDNLGLMQTLSQIAAGVAGAVSLLALSLAAIGIYGVVAYVVSRRRTCRLDGRCGGSYECLKIGIDRELGNSGTRELRSSGTREIGRSGPREIEDRELGNDNRKAGAYFLHRLSSDLPTPRPNSRLFIMSLVRFSPSSKGRLTRRDLDRFPEGTLFHRIGRAVCEAECLPRKELFEAWEVARRVRRLFRGGRVVDVGGGHGLLAQVMLLLDDSSPAALVIDPALPPSSAAVHQALVRAWPRLAGRVAFVGQPFDSQFADAHSAERRSLEGGSLQATDIVVSSHACGALTDRVLDAATRARARVAVLPCCHDLATCDTGGLTGWIDSALAIDVARAMALRAHGYRVWTQRIPADITPKNRLLIGAPRLRA